MTIYSIFTLVGGLAFFLFGMNVMSGNLEKVAGGKLESSLKKMTSNRFKALALGAIITIAIQSSSALTVMLVGLVNSGIMELSQTVGVIMGSNIGTTLTAWILSMSGIKSDNFLISMLKPENFSPIIALIGVIMIMMAKKQQKKDVGRILAGFAVLMFGMELMKDAVSPLADSPSFSHVLTAFSNPFLGVAIGAGFTGIIQSSAASVGVLQALAMTGSISTGMAIPIIMGQNIGTCVTSLLSSIGVNKNAKRVAVIHISFNLIGTAVCLVIYFIVHFAFHPAFLDRPIDPVGIAGFHSIFNIFTTAILLPFSKQLVKIAHFVIRDKEENSSSEETVLLDERLLLSPGMAVSRARDITNEMARLSSEAFSASMTLFDQYDEKAADLIYKNEDMLDKYEDALGTFLIRLSSRDVTTQDNNAINEMLHCINDFERIGDHSINMAEGAQKMRDQKISFSEGGYREIHTMFQALQEIVSTTCDCYIHDDTDRAQTIEPLKEVIDDMTKEIKDRHVVRLQRGICPAELSIIVPDMITNCERVSDHCSNIAVCIVQTRNSAYEKHGYLRDLKSNSSTEFLSEFETYSKKYRLENYQK